jgi:hypothetical protein
LPLDAAFAEIRQFGPEADLKGGARRKGRKGSRKNKKSRKTRKQRGGLYRWGGGGRRSAFQNMYGGSTALPTMMGGRRRSAFQNMMGGSAQDMSHPMDVSEEGKMLIPPSLQAQAGMNPEWGIIERDGMAFAPK